MRCIKIKCNVPLLARISSTYIVHFASNGVDGHFCGRPFGMFRLHQHQSIACNYCLVCCLLVDQVHRMHSIFFGFFLLQRQRRRNGAMRNTNTHSNQTANYVNHFSAFLHRHSGDVEVAATAGTTAATRRSIVSGIGHWWMEKCSSTMHVSAVHKSDRQRMPNACTYLFVFHLGAVSAKHSNIKRRNCRRESFSQLAIQVDSRIPWHERREIETEAHSSSQTKRTKCKANAMCSKNSAHSCIIYELRNRFVCFEYNCERIYCY